MINPKKLTGYGEGWAFIGRNEGKSVDLSKFAFNKGYMQFVQHFGVTDPLVCELDGPPYWYDYEENIIPVFKELGIEEKGFIQFMSNKTGKNISTIEDAIDTAIERDSGYYIGKFAVSHGLKNMNCLFGITDEDYYFEKRLKDSYDNDETFYDDIDSGRLDFRYYN